MQEHLEMPTTSSPRLNLSIFQMMKVVIFFAVAFASIAPMIHLWQAGVVGGGGLTGLVSVAVFGAVLVPLEWIGLSLILIRSGPRRDTLILCLLLCSVLVALATACWMFLYQLLPAYRRGAARWNIAIPMLIASAVIVILTAATAFLAGRLVRAYLQSRERP
jgi:hypothetical protein